MKKIVVTASAIVFSSLACAASLQSLTQAQVNSQLKGTSIVSAPLATLNGAVIQDPFTGVLAANGNLEGHFLAKPANGPKSDNGTWTVKPNGAFCATWQHWNNNKPNCGFVYKVSNGLVIVNESTNAIETVILSHNIKKIK